MAMPTRLKKFYTLPSIKHMEKAGTSRGNNHDKQDLGILMPAMTTLSIRQVNTNFKAQLVLSLYNDNSKKEKKEKIPPNGEWVKVMNEYDAVPFVQTVSNCNEEPVIEFGSEPGVPPLLVFRPGDDEGEFFKQWDATEAAPFVLLSGNRVQLLVPKVNKDFLRNLATRSDLKSIDELFQFYEAVVSRYDVLLGLSDEASDPVHKNVHTKYFVKANAQGPGGAYYGNEHVAGSYASLEMFLKRGWGPLHEFGHGYQGGFMSPKSKDDMSLSEVWNNIYAHSFEVLYNTQNGWLYGKNRQKFETDLYTKRTNGSTYQTFGLRERLYMHVILKELTGDSAMIHFNTKYRKQRNEGRDGGRRTTDLLAEYWSEGAKFDVIPYYEQYGLTVSDDTKEKLFNCNLESGCVLRDLVSSDEIAEEIRNAANLKSIYSIIKTNQMQNKQLKGTVVVKVTIAEFGQVQGGPIYIMDGENIVGKSLVEEQEITIDDIDAGVYLVRGPYAMSKPYHANSKRVIVSQGHETLVELNYLENLTCPASDPTQIVFQGLGDSIFVRATISAVKRNMNLEFTGAKPHCYFPDKLYASIEILDGSESLYKKEFLGTTTGAFSDSIEINNGYKIQITHVEPGRLKVYNSFLQTYDAEFATKDKNNTYVVTKYGLMLASWTKEQQKESYINKLDAYLSQMTKVIGDDTNELHFTAERNQIQAAISILPEPIMQEYLKKYQSLILRSKFE